MPMSPLRPRSRRRSRRSPCSPAASATRRCAIAARSAARSPMPIRRRTIPPAVLGLGATIVTDRREIPADEFFTGLFETALAPGEIITAVRFPVPDMAGYAKFRSPASRYRPRRRVRREDGDRRPCRGHRRGPARLPLGRDRGGAVGASSRPRRSPPSRSIPPGSTPTCTPTASIARISSSPWRAAPSPPRSREQREMEGSKRVEPARGPEVRTRRACRRPTCSKGYPSGRFTPVDVIEEVIGALEATDALCNVVVTDMYDVGARPRRSGPPPTGPRQGRRAARRRSGHGQGSALRRRRAGPCRHRPSSPISFRPRISAVVSMLQGGRRHHHLQDHDLRIRLQADRRQPALRHHPQSLEPRADQRRLERRRRGGGRGRLRAARHRHRRAWARSACRRRSAASSASSRPSAWCRARRASSRRPGARSPIPGRSAGRCRTWRCSSR